MKQKTYTPQPIDTTGVELPEELEMLVEQMSKNVHEVWSETRFQQGWTGGTEGLISISRGSPPAWLCPPKKMLIASRSYRHITYPRPDCGDSNKGVSIKRI